MYVIHGKGTLFQVGKGSSAHNTKERYHEGGEGGGHKQLCGGKSREGRGSGRMRMRRRRSGKHVEQRSHQSKERYKGSRANHNRRAL